METRPPVIVTINALGKAVPPKRHARGKRHPVEDRDKVQFQGSPGTFEISFKDGVTPFEKSSYNVPTGELDVHVQGSEEGDTYPYEVLRVADPDVASERMAAVGAEPPEMIID